MTAPATAHPTFKGEGAVSFIELVEIEAEPDKFDEIPRQLVIRSELILWQWSSTLRASLVRLIDRTVVVAFSPRRRPIAEPSSPVLTPPACEGKGGPRSRGAGQHVSLFRRGVASVSGGVPGRREEDTMTAQKSFKRLVRARMAKTGESYTAARAQLLAGAEHAPADALATGEGPPLVCSDARIRERTGRGWEEWFDLLDSWGAESMGHTELARKVSDELGVHLLRWEAQAVTTSFERARGMRAVGERVGRDGFVASASRTIGARAEDVFTAFVDPSRRAGWLPDLELSERTVSKPTRARFDVGDGTTRLVVSVEPKGPAKSTVVVEHTRLAGADVRDERKSAWRRWLVTLKEQLERDASPTTGRRRAPDR